MSRKQRLKKEERLGKAHIRTVVSQRRFAWWLPPLIILGLVFATYANGLNNEFVSDDIPSILTNKNLGDFASVTNSFSGSVGSLIHYLIFHIFGLSPWSYRMVNLVFHAINSLLVYHIGLKLLDKRIAFLASMVFGVHPLLSESVVWISGYPYVLAGFFVLLSFYLYLPNDRHWFVKVVGLTSFAMTFTANEKYLAMPLMFLLVDLWLKRGWKRLPELLVYFCISLMMVIYLIGIIPTRATVLETRYSAERQTGWYLLWQQPPVALGSYLSLFYWPVPLTFYHTEMTFTIMDYLLFVVAVLSIAFMAVLLFKKNKWISFWFLFFLIGLLPTLAPLGLGWIVAERYAYLATIGLIFVTILVLDLVFGKYNRLALIFGGILVVVLAIRTTWRNSDWKNADTLWLATARYSPSSYQNHNNLGDMYMRDGQYDMAIEEFKTAIKLNPRYANAYHNLANGYLAINNIEVAENNYKKAIDVNPKIWQSYQQLATISAKRGDWGGAEKIVLDGIANTQSVNLWIMLADIYTKMGKVREADKIIGRINRLQD